MGRKPCCSKVGLNRGTWTAQEDKILTSYIKAHGEGQWRNLPKRAGLKRCGKSCRLRWLNYLKPDIKRGNITPDEEELILRLHRLLGNRWALIAGRLPGRTDNEIKNYWHTTLGKKAKPQSPKPNYKDPLNTTTEVLKPLPTKATRAVNCPEFPIINSNHPNLSVKFDLHHNDLEFPVFQRDEYHSLGDDLGFFDYGDDPFPVSNCRTSLEALLMEECINNVNSEGEDEKYKNSLDMESLDMFLNIQQWP